MNGIRVGSGRYRGRVLPVVAAGGVRPVKARVRSTVFSWLGQNLAGKKVLDVFSGSGIMAVESLSRGALSAYCMDGSLGVVEHLERVKALLNEKQMHVCHWSYPAFFDEVLGSDAHVFDLVFWDPPYGLTGSDQGVRFLAEQRLITSETIIYIEWAKGDGLISAVEEQGFGWVKRSSSAGVGFGLIKKEEKR